MVDVEHRELTFYLNTKEVKFNMCALMKRPIDVIVMSIVDVDDPCNIEVPIEERLSVELLAAVIMNFIEV